MKPRRKATDRRRGAVLVEAALVLPVVLLFLLGIMEYGRWLMTVNVFNNAAVAGASYAAKHGDPIYFASSGTAVTTYGSAVSDVQTVVTNDLAGLQLGSQAINVFLSDSLGNNIGAWTGAAPGQYVCVQITGVYRFIVPTLLRMSSGTMNFTFQSVRSSEGN